MSPLIDWIGAFHVSYKKRSICIDLDPLNPFKGHVLFEMCAGYELYAARPSARHLEDLKSYPQVI